MWHTDRWRRIGLAASIGLIGMVPGTWPELATSPDWTLWRALPDALASGRLYDTATEAPFVWSPLAAWFMAFVPTVYWPWFALHLVAVLVLRDWRLIVLVFLSWGFWTSTASGSPFIFIFLAGVLALRGSRPAGIAYLGLCLLMPRPIQLPLALWLLLTVPSLRWPFAGIIIVHTTVVLSTGYAFQWIESVAGHTLPAGNYGPTSFLGLWWLVAGIPLGTWLTLRGHVGLAGLAISPYWLPEYLLMALIDLVPVQGGDRVGLTLPFPRRGFPLALRPGSTVDHPHRAN